MTIVARCCSVLPRFVLRLLENLLGFLRGVLTRILLTAAAPGDANFDGLVDVADLGIVGANFNADDMQWNTGDFNLDGTTDVADLGILGANWTALQTTGNASALVPEPATLSLLAMSVLVVGRRRR